jgi:ZIP family zinc transporter
MTTTLIIGLLIPLLGTMLGSAFVFFIGSLSGAVEPVGALAVLLLASMIMPVLPYMLAFAAGAMFYVVVEELIPEASSGKHSNLSTIGFAIGFVLMMVLDVVMG